MRLFIRNKCSFAKFILPRNVSLGPRALWQLRSLFTKPNQVKSDQVQKRDRMNAAWECKHVEECRLVQASYAPGNLLPPLSVEHQSL